MSTAEGEHFNALVLLTWNDIATFSEECVVKLARGELLLYLVVSSALER